ncbi:hypothetical protein DL765_003728 [Monosporascus sp. GIB2]|nr:hypothetical protein DL765_003728 [Monosporascus sp. GIB2]
MHTSQGVMAFVLLCHFVFAARTYDHKPAKNDSTNFVKSSSETTLNAGDRSQVNVRQSVAYWLPKLAPAGKQPLSGDGYKFYRDVTDYGAKNDGSEDASEAINAAVQDGNRCGQDCGHNYIFAWRYCLFPKNGSGGFVSDSTIRNIKTGILTNDRTDGAPNIVLDNVAMSNVESMVQVHGGVSLLPGTSDDTTIALWASGRRYTGGDGTSETGDLTMPSKPEGLLANGRLFSRSRPQYEDLDASAFMVATDEGIANDGTGDQTQKINAFLQEAQAVNAIAYFPAGIYQVQGTVKIPIGSKLQGSSWSQIMGTGSFFEDSSNPQVMVQVGEKGDTGSLEIVDMLFTVKGPTAGAILMVWNVRGDTQGSAGMWDSHFRVDGALGSDLDHTIWPTSGVNEKCIAASLLLHVIPEASGYFENVWAWIADQYFHPQDITASRISVYAARGMLIGSQGPSWFYATSAEYAVLYQYQLYEAKNIYLGHIQTETPYYQPAPPAPEPFATGSFSGDPDFADCTEDSCKKSWALGIIGSAKRIAQVTGSSDITFFNILTKGSREIASGNGYALYQNDEGNQPSGDFTSEISVWFPLSEGTQDSPDVPVVYVGTEVYETPTILATGSVVVVLPPSPLPDTTTISIDPYTTSLEYGHITTTVNPQGGTVATFVTTTTTVTLTPPAITTTAVQFSNICIRTPEVNIQGWHWVLPPGVYPPGPPPDIIDFPPKGWEIKGTLPPWPKITDFFELSQVSIPNAEYWPLVQNEHVIPQIPDDPDGPTTLYKYWYDDSSGDDQYVYLAGELGEFWDNHTEFNYAGWKFETVAPLAGYGADPGVPELGAHLNGVAAKVNGWNLGVALEATVVKLNISSTIVANVHSYTVQVYEKVLEQLLNAANHIKENNRQGKAVVNLSAGWKANQRPATFFTRMSNDGPGPIDEYPANFGYANIFSSPLPNMIIVGATTPDGRMWQRSQYDDWITTFAPGAAISIPHEPNDQGTGFYDMAQGTSFAAPMTAGLACYFRALPSPWQEQLRDPANVKKMIRLFHRKLDIWMPQVTSNQDYKPSIWNGQVREKSCLLDIDNTPWDGWELCPDINRDLSQQPDNGAPVSGGCDSSVAARDILQGRDDGLGCSVSNLRGTPISYAPGSASPTCLTNCGELCDGYYCQTQPTGPPPDHYDPKDPENPTATSDEPPQPTEACDDKCKLDRGYPCNCNETVLVNGLILSDFA